MFFETTRAFQNNFKLISICINSMGGLMSSDGRRDLQEQVWREIVDALKARVPEVEQLARKEY